MGDVTVKRWVLECNIREKVGFVLADHGGADVLADGGDVTFGDMNIPGVDDLDLTTFNDDALTALAAFVAEEQRRRALLRGDLPALIEDGFSRGFGRGNNVADPWVADGILIAPGGKFDKSSASHNCTFVRVSDRWVWESSEKLEDEIRRTQGQQQSMRSVTLVVVHEGDKIDVLSSRARNGVHELQQVRSFVYEAGDLVMVDARTVRSSSHR